MRLMTVFVLFLHALFAGGSTDFDVVVVGTSPVSMLAALYESYSGRSVLVVEGDSSCGGAWKAIDICGIAHADLGCHQIGGDQNLKKFLEEQIGCKLVSLSNPSVPFGKGGTYDANGFYPSQGCYELIGNLLRLMQKTDIVLLMQTRLESVYIDEARKAVEATTTQGKFWVSKVIVTPSSDCRIENLPGKPVGSKMKYYHLYLLIEDATKWRFTYQSSSIPGSSRLMNLTPFVGLEGTGQQLIVIQTNSEVSPLKGGEYLAHLKRANLIDSGARLVNAETHLYEQVYNSSGHFSQLPSRFAPYFEVLNVSHIQSISSYLPKWRPAFEQALASRLANYPPP